MRQRLWLVLAAYGALSAACFFLPLFPFSHPLIKGAIKHSVLWLLGPPANLIYQFNWAIVFVVGSAVFLPCLWIAMATRRSHVRVAASLFAALAWALFGFLAHAPAI